MRILHIEDNEGDALLTKEALTDSKDDLEIFHCFDGPSGLKYLDENPIPQLILLDLNMPGMSGREVLRKIRENPKTLRIPVVVLTTSSNPSDIKECYEDGCNAYIIKHPKFSEYKQAMQKMISYWSFVVSPPE